MTFRVSRFGPRSAFAAVAVLLWGSTVRSEWVMVQPPVTGQRDCELVYDQSAPIAKWQLAWQPPFETLEACEVMLAEIVRRSTAPGRRNETSSMRSAGPGRVRLGTARAIPRATRECAAAEPPGRWAAPRNVRQE